MADEATKAKLRSSFDKLTPQDFAAVAGNREGLIEKVAEKYGISKDEAKKQVDDAFSNAGVKSPNAETPIDQLRRL
ncbi:hypothetical protein EDD37DRAFT_646383 [Exophiala viscosa]|uniref:uncharacterized protein n=1 Tax=Exophiala viscosa TaxID=2486360 RepID=UPI002193F553|nr:hypothetical protein EDD37DRAFT_646383 [Exophiala viscosa]